MTPTGRNQVRLITFIDGEPRTNFVLQEFENPEGLAMVHSTNMESLERTRQDLCEQEGEEVLLIITDAVRTPVDNEVLGKKYGWTGQGGKVSWNSKHLAEFGGVAQDLKAKVKSTRSLIPQKQLGDTCRKYFDFVKDDYRDGHVHADNRVRGV